MRLAEIAERFGTPAYVYDLAAVRAAAAELRSDLPTGARLFYSLKANPHPLLVETLRAAGCDAEVSSVGEVHAAVAAGCPPERMLHTGPGKSRAELTASLAAGVRLFSVESLTDRDRLADVAAGCDVRVEYLVRLNGPAGSSGGSLRMTGRPSAFGVDTGDRDVLARLLRPYGPSRPVGLHTFFATNVPGEAALVAEFDQALATVAAVGEHTGFTPELIDLGGGFAAPNARPGRPSRYPTLAGAVTSALDRLLPAASVQVAFESGRNLVAAAGTLLTRVLDVKRSGGRTFTVLDAGVHTLGGMSGLGRLMTPRSAAVRLDVPETSAEPEASADPDARDERDGVSTALVGPLCTPLDVLNSGLAIEARVDDVLAIPNVGAYGLTASLVGFLSHPLAVEVVHDGGRFVSARRLALRPVEIRS